MLVGAAVTGPEDELRSVRGIGAGVVEAFTRGGVYQLPALGLPLLVGAAVASPQFDEGAVGGFGAGDVHAAAGDREGAVAVNGPVLRGRVAVAVPHLHLGAGGTAAVVVIHALGAVVAGHDGPGRPGAAGRRRVADRDDVRLNAAVGGIGRVAGGHDAFEERPGGAVAVVAADPEDDGAFLVHGHVTARSRQGTAVPGGQPARIRVAADRKSTRLNS